MTEEHDQESVDKIRQFCEEIKTQQEIDPVMLDLFKSELESQTKVLSQGLLELERSGINQEHIKTMMRAAHSIKGATKVIGLDPVVTLSHSMEDYFVALQNHGIAPNDIVIDLLLKAVDWLANLSKQPQHQMIRWMTQGSKQLNEIVEEIKNVLAGKAPKKILNEVTEQVKVLKKSEVTVPTPTMPKIELREGVERRTFKKLSERQIKVEDKRKTRARDKEDRVLRVTAQNLNRLMGLAGESVVESRWMQPFADSLMALKTKQSDMIGTIDLLRSSLAEHKLNSRVLFLLDELQLKANDVRQHIGERVGELELFSRRFLSLSDRLYREVIQSRMRPFSDGVEGFPRMMRDLAKELHKRVSIEIIGAATPVDREILEKLEAPLNHFLRNAVDHGIEKPEERKVAGKPEEGMIKMEAMHRAGMLSITITDDGRGVDNKKLLQKILERNLVSAEMAKTLTDSELLDFLFLPGFSTSEEVTEISGRGVGLNIVQTMLQDVGGLIRTENFPGKGMSFHLQLPLTLSVIRALILEISGEPYALPLAHIEQLLQVPKQSISIVENREYYFDGTQNIGLIPAYQVLELYEGISQTNLLSVAVISDRVHTYGIVVDRFIGERELVVQELDPLLGKVANINEGALLEDGSPVLIIDVEDMIRSIDNLLTGKRLKKTSMIEKKILGGKKKSILVVDDSITVREVECRLLRNNNYEVDTAVNGMDGWNAVRMGQYDLVITDLDMPRMHGIELVKMIKADRRLKNIPVMIVSYKEREEDRMAGLEAGANYYLTKSSFHDETLLQAVRDLIGE